MPLRQTAMVLLAASVLATGSILGRHVIAETDQPSIRRADLRVSLLHAGSTGADVEQILGQPARATELDGEIGNTALLYNTQDIRTRVVLSDNRVTAIALDPVYVDPAPLPARARLIKATMVRDGVAGLLGLPDSDQRWSQAGCDIEQMTFTRRGEPEFSVFLADGLVVDVRPGHDKPQGLTALLLPAPVADSAVGSDLAIGLTPAQAAPLLGVLESAVRFALKGQPVEYASYHQRDGNGRVTATFIGGVLTAFTMWPAGEL